MFIIPDQPPDGPMISSMVTPVTSRVFAAAATYVDVSRGRLGVQVDIDYTTSAQHLSVNSLPDSGQSVISCLTMQLNMACPLLSLSSLISQIIVASTELNCLLAGFKIDNLLVNYLSQHWLVVLIM